MGNLEVYKKIKSIKKSEDIVQYFLATLLLTNRRWSFYVNWKKVSELTSKYKIEIGILEAVLGADEKEFFQTIKKYPEVVKVFPRLMAVRDDVFSILEDPFKKKFVDFNFNSLPQTDSEINKYTAFWKESGLADALKEVKNLKDYFYGVEVGSDTNARKNRGGTEWEDLIEPLIRKIAKKHGYKIEVRQKFEKVLKKLGYDKPSQELSRNMDFLVYKGNKFVDIEANYFSGSGTKLEVPGAYVNRTVSEGFTLSLFLFTDGLGWQTAKHRMHEFFEKFPCVTNYHMAKQGVLEAALIKYSG